MAGSEHNVILLGPPGAGKGTQANLIIDTVRVPQVSTGDMFRAAKRSGTPLGSKAKAFMDKGQLVPDEVTLEMVKERLAEDDCKNGFLLDGFPRTVPQAEGLNRLLSELKRSLTHVILIEVPDSELIKRLTGRRSCPGCGKAYHVEFKPARDGVHCDACGAELITRVDDTKETVMKRLDVYNAQTAPLIAFYESTRGLLRRIDGTGSIELVTRAVLESLKN